jgi:hypothetical protein
MIAHWPTLSPRARVTVVRLTEVFRQAVQSRIITSTHRINQGTCAVNGDWWLTRNAISHVIDNALGTIEKGC